MFISNLIRCRIPLCIESRYKIKLEFKDTFKIKAKVTNWNSGLQHGTENYTLALKIRRKLLPYVR